VLNVRLPQQLKRRPQSPLSTSAWSYAELEQREFLKQVEGSEEEEEEEEIYCDHPHKSS